MGATIVAKILVVYYSEKGNTKAMAEAVAEGAETVVGPEVQIKRTQDTTVADLIDAQGIAFGTPDHFSYMDGTLKVLFDRAWLQRKQLYGKVWAAFSSGGIDGIKSRESIEWCADHFKPKKICQGVSIAGKPGPEQLEACKKSGIALAEALRQ